MKYFVIFLSTLMMDFLGSWMGYAIAHKWIITQAILGFLLPYMNVLTMAWFIDAKTFKERMYLTTAIAFGMSIGGTIMLLVMT